MLKQKILEEADRAQGKEPLPAGEENQKMALILQMQRDFKRLAQMDKTALTSLGVNKKILITLVKHPEKLVSRDWQQLQKLQQKIAAFKEKLKQRFPSLTDEQLIQQGLDKSGNQRFNVRGDWLPLQ